MEMYAKHGLLVRITYMILAAVNWLLLGWWADRKTIVLCYHGITERQQNAFRNQIVWLSGHFAKKALLPRKSWDYRYVLLTFDDAFENLLDNALPLLNKLHIPAIIFAVPGNLGTSPQWDIAVDHPEYKEKTMNAEQLKSVQNEWITIGSHTQTHPNLSKLPPDQVRWELIESKKNLEQLLGKPVEDLALPHGAYNADVLRIAQEVGYKRIYTLEPKLIRENQKSGAISRFSMSPDVWPIEFYLTCAGAYSWLYPVRKLLRRLRHRTAC